jgi:HSP20 family protein
MTTMLVEPFPPWLRDINRFFSSEGGTMPSAFSPPADVIITDDGVTVAMDVPGIPADKLDIELENDILTVRGERPTPYSDETRGAVRRAERSFGRFERSLRVPRGLDPDSIQARLRDGVLTLYLPKPPSLQPRKIEVRSDGSQPRDIQAQPAVGQGQGQGQPTGEGT